MTNDDINKLGNLIDSKLDHLKGELKDEISATRKDLKDEISETSKTLKDEIAASENRVISGIVEFVSVQLMPVIDEKADKTDIDRLERKLDFYIDKNADLKSRVDDIESLQTVAHELKLKKNKKT